MALIMTYNYTEIREKVRDFIKGTAHSDKIENATLIFREGFMDSMGFIMLITFIEEQFGVKIEDTDLIETNFESVDAISVFVEKKLA